MSDNVSKDPTSGSAYVTVKVDPDPGFKLTFDGLTATEELGRPFLIAVDLSSGEVKGNASKMLGSTVVITMTDADGSTKTYFNGILSRVAYAGLIGGVYRYHVELRPWIWLLSRTQDCKIFQQMSAFDIINKVFKDKNFTATDKRQNQAGSLVLDYCVQYRETSLDFVTRLMERFGIYYYFEHTETEHKLILCDDSNSHTVLSDTIPFDYSQTEQRAVKDHVWEWTSDLHLQPGVYTYRDYNFTTPAADLTAKSLHSADHSYSDYEVYDYPGVYDDTSGGQKLADVRMQDLTSRVQLMEGKSNARGIRCGVVFTLSDFYDEALNQKYLVTRAVTTLTIAEGASDTRGNLVDSQRVDFHAIPSATPFKLEQHTPRPMIRGPQTAIVVGESGEEITTDKYGRIKVQFYWDRVGTNDQNSSCWIRVAQSWGGGGWGAMFIPRIGMEVVVVFLEGNPDRPLITGVVYNATQTVPNSLPDKKVLTTFKTNSSKGGGGFNELTFDDTKGNEAVNFQAQYNYNKKVLNNEVVEITKDTTTTVKEGNRKMTVSQGNDDHTVSQGNQSLTVSAGNQTIAISAGGAKTTTGQAFEVTAGTSVKLTATASIELTCGGASLKMTPSGITFSAPQVSGTADASMSLDGGGSMSLTAGMISIN